MKNRILIIEDEEDIRELVRYNLEREGFSVSEAESGEEGLKKITGKGVKKGSAEEFKNLLFFICP